MVLELIQKFFKGAGIISKRDKDSLQLRVRSLQDLTNIIIPHGDFDKYPLLTQKHADFILFKQVMDLINRGEHLTIEGLHKIVAIKASINKGFSEERPFQRLFLYQDL